MCPQKSSGGMIVTFSEWDCGTVVWAGIVTPIGRCMLSSTVHCSRQGLRSGGIIYGRESSSCDIIKWLRYSKIHGIRLQTYVDCVEIRLAQIFYTRLCISPEVLSRSLRGCGFCIMVVGSSDVRRPECDKRVSILFVLEELMISRWIESSFEVCTACLRRWNLVQSLYPLLLISHIRLCISPEVLSKDFVWPWVLHYGSRVKILQSHSRHNIDQGFVCLLYVFLSYVFARSLFYYSDEDLSTLLKSPVFL